MDNVPGDISTHVALSLVRILPARQLHIALEPLALVQKSLQPPLSYLHGSINQIINCFTHSIRLFSSVDSFWDCDESPQDHFYAEKQHVHLPIQWQPRTPSMIPHLCNTLHFISSQDHAPKTQVHCCEQSSLVRQTPCYFDREFN